MGVVVEALSASAQVGDPDSTRRVYAAIAAFVIIGIAMLALAVWLIRRTRPEPQLLAPLEAMEATSWRRSSAAERNRELDRLRPAGAVPLRRSTSEPDLDESFEAIAPVRNFDDLDDAGAVGLPRAERDLTPVGASALDTDTATDTDADLTAADTATDTEVDPTDDIVFPSDDADVEAEDIDFQFPDELDSTTATTTTTTAAPSDEESDSDDAPGDDAAAERSEGHESGGDEPSDEGD